MDNQESFAATRHGRMHHVEAGAGKAVPPAGQTRQRGGGSMQARIQALLAAGLACLAAWTPAGAQTAYPEGKPVTILVGTPPGGALDGTARLLGTHLTRLWGQTVLVENRSGASATIAAAAMAKSPPDGHTLLLTSRGIAMAPALYPRLTFDTSALTAVAAVSEQPTLLMVSPGFPARTLPDFLKLVKASPGKFTYGTTGNGSLPHVAAEMFQGMTGASIVHIPYKGGAPLLLDMMSNRVDFMFASPGVGSVKDGKTTPIAILAATRSPLFPDLPTFGEVGLPEFTMETWYGLFAPANTPREVVEKIAQGVTTVLANPEAQQQLKGLGSTPGATTPAGFQASFQDDLRRFARIIHSTGMKID